MQNASALRCIAPKAACLYGNRNPSFVLPRKHLATPTALSAMPPIGRSAWLRLKISNLAEISAWSQEKALAQKVVIQVAIAVCNCCV